MIVASAMLTGCATHLQAPKKAYLAIPVACIDRAVKFIDGTVCEAFHDQPDYAKCKGGMIVHFTCTTVVKGKQ